MPSHAIHNPSYRNTSHVGDAGLPKNKQKETSFAINKFHFSRVDLYGPTKKHESKASRKSYCSKKSSRITMNTQTKAALIELCEAIQDFARANPMAETGPLQRACSKAKDALRYDETIVETGTTNSQS